MRTPLDRPGRAGTTPAGSACAGRRGPATAAGALVNAVPRSGQAHVRGGPRAGLTQLGQLGNGGTLALRVDMPRPALPNVSEVIGMTLAQRTRLPCEVIGGQRRSSARVYAAATAEA